MDTNKLNKENKWWNNTNEYVYRKLIKSGW